MIRLINYYNSINKNKFLAKIVICSPKYLNALDLNTLYQLKHLLIELKHNNNLSAIWLEGEGANFCSGGNIKKLYYALKTRNLSYVKEYINNSYHVCYLLNQLKVPTIAFGTGVVMGMGAGIYQATKYRLASQTLKFAMPETAIGLYPDGLASYFFKQISFNLAKFLAITGIDSNVVEAEFLGLVDYGIKVEDKQDLFNQIIKIDPKQLSAEIKNIIARKANSFKLTNKFLNNLVELKKVAIANNLVEMIKFILALKDNDFWKQVKNKINYASPLAMALSFELLNKTANMDLNMIIEYEKQFAKKNLNNFEAITGIENLIITKEKKPQWKFSKIDKMTLNFANKCLN